LLAYIFVFLAVAVRLIPHPFSFTPVAASLLFFGARGSRKQAWIPVLLLAATDIILNRRYGYATNWTFLITWAWYGAMIALGSLLRRKQGPARVVGAGLAAALSFFLVSNFAVWAAGTMYPLTISGLAASFVAAIPFFRNELVSDVLFTAVLFSLPALVQLVRPHEQKA
jgi:hypothetical protein